VARVVMLVGQTPPFMTTFDSPWLLLLLEAARVTKGHRVWRRQPFLSFFSSSSLSPPLKTKLGISNLKVIPFFGDI
jgi:hypothetical protein